MELTGCFFFKLKNEIDAQHRPQGGAAGDAAGVGNATSGSITDRLTREHRMTADEARLILNVKREDGLETILKVSPSVSYTYAHIHMYMIFDLAIPIFLT